MPPPKKIPLLVKKTKKKTTPDPVTLTPKVTAENEEVEESCQESISERESISENAAVQVQQASISENAAVQEVQAQQEVQVQQVQREFSAHDVELNDPE